MFLITLLDFYNIRVKPRNGLQCHSMKGANFKDKIYLALTTAHHLYKGQLLWSKFDHSFVGINRTVVDAVTILDGNCHNQLQQRQNNMNMAVTDKALVSCAALV